MNIKEIYYTLEEAISANNPNKVSEIINEYPDLNLNNGDAFVFNPPLYRASMCGYNGICEILIKNGAEVNYTGDNLYYPLEGAASKNHLETIKLLLENGADINAYEITILSAIGSASSKGYCEVVKYLKKRGADINRLTLHQYLTPLDLALIYKQEKIINILKEFKAISNIKRDYDWKLEHGGGISAHIDYYIGRVIPVKFNITEDGVFNRLAVVNKEKNILLFSVGNYQFTKPHAEFIMILPLGWNPYSMEGNSVFPYLVMKELTAQIKRGRQFNDGDFISKNDIGFNSIAWIESLAGFYVVDYNYTINDNISTEDLVYLYTLIPVMKTKNGYSMQSLEKLKSKKWKSLEIPNINTIRPKL